MKREFHFLYSIFLLLNIWQSPIKAHNIKTSEDVGVTFHIEPDHSPKVGESSQAWFALTRRGGAAIPLSECHCELRVYATINGKPGQQPIQKPALVAISPEKYQNIPGADLEFSQPGIYELELTGEPVTPNDFAPFKVSYPVTVKPGSLSNSEIISETAQESLNKPEVRTNNFPTDLKLETEESQLNKVPWILAFVGGGLALSLLILGSVNKKNGGKKEN